MDGTGISDRPTTIAPLKAVLIKDIGGQLLPAALPLPQHCPHASPDVKTIEKSEIKQTLQKTKHIKTIEKSKIEKLLLLLRQLIYTIYCL